MMNELEKYVNLNSLSIGLPGIKNLFARADYDLKSKSCLPLLDKIYSADDKTLKNVYGLSPCFINKFKQIKKNNPAKTEIEKCKKLGIKIIILTDNLYPHKLREIFDPPLCLYCKGGFAFNNDITIAIVGARKATSFGRQNAENLSLSLAEYGITIVSGMARGIDTHAHIGALRANGKTIAVLGCGLDIVYPPENKKLMNQICADGACLSEFPLGTAPNAWNFPVRNRIISGLSRAVIVVEAGNKSGSLITANCALEQGKDVFAMPGNILSNVAKGVNTLIKEGAALVENAEDVLTELNIDLTLKTKKKESDVLNLNNDEQKIYSVLEEPLNIEDILIKINIPINTLISTLILMASKNIIKKLPGNVYVRQ